MITTQEGVRLAGTLGLEEAPSIYATLRSAQAPNKELYIDIQDVEHMDTVALAALIAGGRSHAERGTSIRCEGRRKTAQALEQALQRAPVYENPPAMTILERIGAQTLEQASSARELVSMTGSVFHRLLQLVTRKYRLPHRSLGDKIVSMGTDATGIVTLLSLLLGMILAFEASEQLGQLGAKLLVPDVVGLSLVREFAPLLCAVVVIARNGAAIASELASMQAGQEVDALRTMGIEPVRFLVIPRNLGLVVTGPVLTLLSIFVGLAGAAGVAVLISGLEPRLFYRRLVEAVELGDLGFGLSKSVVFAMTTGLAASAIGMCQSGSAADVGRSTTRAVVLGIFLLVVADAVFAFSSGVFT